MTDSQALQIKQYLKSLDLIVECPIEYAPGAEKEQRVLFTQPGMRYCQAQALVYSLMQDETFSQLSSDERDYIWSVSSEKSGGGCWRTLSYWKR
ncbi:MAG: hypothetical protein ACLR23_24050 [Clostridia bacterium]